MIAQNYNRSTNVAMEHNLRLSSTPLKSIDYMPFRLVVYAQFYNSKMNFS